MKSTIALCDILGFKDLVDKYSLNEISSYVFGWLRKSLSHSIYKNDFPNNTPSFQELNNNQSIGIAWFSDTMLLYTKKDNDQVLNDFLYTLSWFLFETILSQKRIRGAVSYGDIYIDNSNLVYFGKPIIDASKLEKKQEWSGIALTKEAVNRVPEKVRGGKYPSWGIIPYNVPLKDNQIFHTLAINWTLGGFRQYPLNWSSKKKLPSAEDFRVNFSIAQKFMNTKKFYDDVRLQRIASNSLDLRKLNNLIINK